MFTFSNLTKLLATVAAILLITLSYAQGGKADPPGKGGTKKGNGSNGNGPKPAGQSAGTLVYANATLLTPTAFLSDHSFAFADGGGTPKQTYGTTPDMVSQFGGGYVSANKRISAVSFVTVNDVSKVDNFSYNMIVSGAIGTNNAISIGATHLFANQAKTDAPASYYVVASHASKALRNPGNPVVTYTVGYGSGRFLEKSEYDYRAGRGTTGTGLFGSVSYAIVKEARINAEWTGMNLAISTAITPKPNLPSLYIGVTDLTRYTGDRPVFMFSVGHAVSIGKH